MVTGENIRGHVGNFLHVFIFVHGSFDPQPNHLLGELAIAEEEIDKKLELRFDFWKDVGLFEKLGNADLWLWEKVHQLIWWLVHHNIYSTVIKKSFLFFFQTSLSLLFLKCSRTSSIPISSYLFWNLSRSAIPSTRQKIFSYIFLTHGKGLNISYDCQCGGIFYSQLGYSSEEPF